MASSFSIDITMSQDTVSKLKAAGFLLYGFKAVQTNIKNAAPLIWFQTDDYLVDTNVNWQEQFEGYISKTEIASGVTIVASNSIGIDLGQTMLVQQDGTLSVENTGQPGSIAIENKGTAPWTTGISEVVNGQSNMLVAMPLFGEGLDLITPVEKVLLMFATQPVDTGTVVMQSFGPGALIDLTGVTSRAVTYDINEGWGPTTAAWLTEVPVDSALTPLLINPPNS